MITLADIIKDTSFSHYNIFEISLETKLKKSFTDIIYEDSRITFHAKDSASNVITIPFCYSSSSQARSQYEYFKKKMLIDERDNTTS